MLLLQKDYVSFQVLFFVPIVIFHDIKVFLTEHSSRDLRVFQETVSGQSKRNI